MRREKKYIVVAFVVGIVYRLLMSVQGIDTVDMGYCMTFYQNIFSHPDALPYYFNYYLTGLVGGVWHLLLGGLGLMGFRVLELLTMTLAVWLLYLSFRRWLTSARVAAVAVLLSFLFPSFVVTFHFDTLAFLLMSASVYFLSHWFGNGRPLWMMLAGCMIGLSCFTRNMTGGLIALAVLPFYWGAQTSWRKAQNNVAYYVSGMAVGTLAVISVMALLGHLPYYLTALQEMLDTVGSAQSSHGVAVFWRGYFKSYINIGLQIVVIALMALYFGDASLLSGRLRAIIRTVMLAGLFVLVLTSQPYLSAVAICTLLIAITKEPHPLTFYALACAYLFPFGSGSSIPGVFHWCGGLLIIPAACCYLRLGSQWQRTVTSLVGLCIAVNMVYRMGSKAYGEEHSRLTTTEVALPGTLNTMTQKERAVSYRNVVARIREYAGDGKLLLLGNQASELYYATGMLPFTGNTQVAAFLGDELTARLDRQEAYYGQLPLIALLKHGYETEPDDSEEFRVLVKPWMEKHDYRMVYEDEDIEIYGAARLKNKE
jgi:hypothetical protein